MKLGCAASLLAACRWTQPEVMCIMAERSAVKLREKGLLPVIFDTASPAPVLQYIGPWWLSALPAVQLQSAATGPTPSGCDAFTRIRINQPQSHVSPRRRCP